MRLTLFRSCFFLLLLNPVVVKICAQSTAASTPSASEFRYDIGSIANGVYTNDCFGLSITIPADWTVSTFLGLSQGKAVHLHGGSLELLVLNKNMNGVKGAMASLSGDPSRDPLLSAEDVAENSALAQVASDPARKQIIRAAYAVNYGGRQFYRADYKQVRSSGDTLYLAYVVTLFRGHYISASLMAESPERLNEAADLLKTIFFQPGSASAKCVVGPDEYAGKWGVIGPAPKPGTFNPEKMRVRVSPSVSQALLLTKVHPEYPEAARQAGVHGPVILQALVGPSGEVKEATVISGDPLLAAAAVAAVKQWKFKPYLLSGQPVAMETTINVEFPEQK